MWEEEEEGGYERRMIVSCVAGICEKGILGEVDQEKGRLRDFVVRGKAFNINIYKAEKREMKKRKKEKGREIRGY